jgi:hypothetical protein
MITFVIRKTLIQSVSIMLPVAIVFSWYFGTIESHLPSERGIDPDAYSRAYPDTWK